MKTQPTVTNDLQCNRKDEALLRLALLSMLDETGTRVGLDAALIVAQSAGVTTSQYLRARLLLGARVAAEALEDSP